MFRPATRFPPSTVRPGMTLSELPGRGQRDAELLPSRSLGRLPGSRARLRRERRAIRPRRATRQVRRRSYPASGASSGGYLPPVTGSTSGLRRRDELGQLSQPAGGRPLPVRIPAGRLPARGQLRHHESRTQAAGYPSTNGYEPAGYESTSSYGLPVGHSGYVNGSGDRPADYSGAGYQPADYPSYGASGPASGSHQRPESGYPSGTYGHGADPAAAGSLPAADAGLGYPVYPAPVPAAQSGYGSADTQLPGYGTAPYQSAGYDPAGYQPPPSEANGYAGADPYAVDPYGQHGYGGTGY